MYDFFGILLDIIEHMFICSLIVIAIFFFIVYVIPFIVTVCVFCAPMMIFVLPFIVFALLVAFISWLSKKLF